MRLKRALFLSACVVLALVAITSAATAVAVISAVSPTSGTRGETVTVTFTGTGFTAGSQVWFFNGQQWLNVQNEQINAQGTRITGSATIPTDAPLGAYAVYIFATGQPVAYKANAFQIRESATVITTVAPTSGNRGDNVTVTLSGTGFKTGASVWFFNGERWLNVLNEAVNAQGTQIMGSLDIPTDAPLGNYSVYLFATGQPVVYKANVFEVKEGATVITTVAPTFGNRGQTVPVTISGTGFAAGSQVWFFNGQQWLNVQNEQVNAQGTQITGSMAVPADASLGAYAVYIFATGQPVVYKANVFEVRAGTPTAAVINTVSPPWARRQTTPVTIPVTISGTGFKPNAQVWFTTGIGFLLTRIDVQNEAVNAQGTQITGTLIIPPGARVGPYAVQVQNPSEPVVVKLNAFTVRNPVATITNFAPLFGIRGTPKTVNVIGNNFRPGAEVVIIKPGAGGTIITATNVNVVNQNLITCTINVPTFRPNGWYDAQVRNQFGDPYANKVNAFFLI